MSITALQILCDIQESSQILFLYSLTGLFMDGYSFMQSKVYLSCMMLKLVNILHSIKHFNKIVAKI